MSRVPAGGGGPRDGAGEGPLVSVVVCTHNRAAWLRDCLESVAAQRAPGIDFEVLVVDNGSTDETPEVVRAFESGGAVRRVYEAELGLCRARNRGWRSARGRYVAYLDDDAIAAPGWLAALVETFRSTPGCGAVGGRVEPIWQAERPQWLSDEIAKSLTIVDWSPQTKVIPDVAVEWLVGANMAVPAAVLAEVGGFHPGLDRVGKQMLSGGDVYLQRKIIERGYRCVYQPAMAVRHRVPASRLTKRWFVRRYFWQGISDAVVLLAEEGSSPRRRLRAARPRLTRMLGSPRALRALLRDTDDPGAFERKCLDWIQVGQIAGLLGAARP